MNIRLSLLLIAAMAFGSAPAREVVTIADVNDHEPLAGVAVIATNGLILGVTDNAGGINVNESDFPLSLNCLGYESFTSAATSADTIFMTPAAYSLPEVAVTPVDRPITRVVTYAREYCTGATGKDTFQMYSDYILEYFFADGKVKGYSKSHRSPNTLARRRFGRLANSEGLDSVMRPGIDDDITTLSFLTNMTFFPYEPRHITEAMKAGNISDTIHGKYCPKFIYRLNNGYFTIDCDVLADEKNHSFSPWFFKMLGMTMEMQKSNWTLMYKQNDGDTYTMRDFIYATHNMHILGKGKLLKKLLGVKDEIHINCYVEQYPVEITHLTVEEYKEMKKTYYERTESMRIPATVQPLPSSIKTLIDRVDREVPVKRRK